MTTDQITDAMPFARALGVEIDTAGPDGVAGRLAWAPERCTAGGLMHGGVIMALADSLGAACAFLNLPEGAATTTLESKTNFFRGVRGGHVRGISAPLHVGRTSIVVQTDLFDDRDRRIAQVTQTQVVLRP
ncbi:PaaI family thioesterase [Actinomadura yumaensis]|uniref:PaaI family thioesterase n=2 Tax=Actinomadura TaxID=1988 RepID=A0ABW2CV18_9ACTN